jgi:hypothetical protein
MHKPVPLCTITLNEVCYSPSLSSCGSSHIPLIIIGLMFDQTPAQFHDRVIGTSLTLLIRLIPSTFERCAYPSPSSFLLVATQAPNVRQAMLSLNCAQRCQVLTSRLRRACHTSGNVIHSVPLVQVHGQAYMVFQPDWHQIRIRNIDCLARLQTSTERDQHKESENIPAGRILKCSSTTQPSLYT